MAKQEFYKFTNGSTMQREPQHPYYWILRDSAGGRIDRDRYRNDMIERHRLEVASHIGGGLYD